MSLDRGMHRLAKDIQADRLRTAADDRAARAAHQTTAETTSERTPRRATRPPERRRPLRVALRGLLGA